MAPQSRAKELNPRTLAKDYEFFGPPGALAITLGVPFMTYAFYFGCNEDVGCSPKSLISAILSFTSWKVLWDPQALKLYLAWYAFQITLWVILPGKTVDGQLLRNGQRKQYKMNGFSTLMANLIGAVAYIIIYGPQNFTFLYDRFVGFATAGLIISIFQAVFVYARSFRKGALLALGGNSGNIIYDFYIGRELNPSIGSFDIKSFNELRAGMQLWALFDLSCVCHQVVTIGRPTVSMMMVCFWHILYIADSVYNESAILTTIDIINDGFGFMLSVSDFLWIPFVYSMQARYLAFTPVELSPLQVTGILAVAATGYYIFRTANLEKNMFRNGQNPKNLTYMTTESGSKLLTSGWWGFLRHPNYLGDWLMSVTWSLPTGFASPIPYFYPLYFAILLVHRDMRDDHSCHKKYGNDWLKYKQLVPYTIIPYVY